MNQNIVLAYDAMNRLTNWTDTYTQTPAAGTTINTTATAAYTWDKNNNRQSSLLNQSSQVNTQAATTTNNTQTLTYGVGNRLNKNTTTRLVGTVANNTHQAIIIDAAGNITNDGIRQYRYTAGNQLSSILVNNITTQYTYDMNNRRVSKISGTNNTAYIYAEDIGDGSTALSATSLLGEYTATATKEYVYLGDTPIAVVQAGNILTIQTDHLDTPRQLTDNTKKVVWNWAYSAFGENQPTNINNTVFNLRYPGQYYDAESKLHYNINRYYDPATGRYTQSDPIGLSGGINTYIYVGGNNIKNSDPTGTMSIILTYHIIVDTVPRIFATGDFIESYIDQLDATYGVGRNHNGWANQDKYFHCKANCEASNRGKAGESTATCLSDFREKTDQLMGDSESASAAAQIANKFGRSQGSKNININCQALCGKYKPGGSFPF
jgi:RHS repeat-associated protein